MTKVLSLLVLSGVLSVQAAAPVAQERPPAGVDARTRDIYVSVVDRKGTPVTGLTEKDFTVREDNVLRDVIRVAPAEAPLDIVVLVDDSQAATTAIPYIRDGLTEFAKKMLPKARIGLVTIGERPTNIVERTGDMSLLKDGIGRIFARSGTGAYLLQGIVEVSRGFTLRESDRPVIIAITTEGVEFSNDQWTNVLRELHASGAIFYALALGTPSSSLADEMRNRQILLAEGTEQTGGRREQLLTDMALPGALQKIGEELLKQHVVTYGRPQSLIPPERIEVKVTNPDLRARARTRSTPK
jgi:VWFA-related protein